MNETILNILVTGAGILLVGGLLAGLGYLTWLGYSRPHVATLQEKRQAQLVCPHCQTRGFVSTRGVTAKRGISGGKAVGALMTVGLSLFLVGLSRKENLTEATCSNCGAVWHF